MRTSTKKGAHFAASGAQAEGSILGSLGDIPLGRACSATAGRTECIRDDGDDDMVHYILQEVVMGGMVLETNMNEIVAQIEAQNRLEKSEGGLSAAPARAVSAVKNINLPEIPRNINIGDLNIKVPNLSQFV
ncbi:hypothetical protein GH733_014910 [Mirounga leonina]|nr:hypothetical protein GH733_014910 [Mirounga leonina]